MDFAATIGVLVSRWYVAVAAFVLTLGISGMVYASVPVQYVSTSVLVLTSPTTGPTEQVDAAHPNGITNPLLYFGQGLTLSASILIQSLSAPDTVASLGITSAGDTTYEVTDGSTNPELLASGPFVYIQGTSTSPEKAKDIVQRVEALAERNLADRQKTLQAPVSTYIKVTPVVPATDPQVRKGTRMRAAGAAATLAMLVGLTSVYAVESVVTRRKKKSGQDSDSDGEIRRRPRESHDRELAEVGS